MSKLRYNKSKTYLLPLLYDLIGMDVRFFNHIDNVYIFDDLNKYQNCIYIEHDFSFKDPNFTAYEHKITKSQYFVNLIDINNQVLYIFKFPEEYMNEYNNLIVGKYSQFGNDAKKLILEFFTKVYQGNLNAVDFLLKTKQILFKDKRLKEKIEKDLNVILSDEAELADIIMKQNETFKLSETIK